MVHFAVSHLQAGQAAEGWPLVRFAMPELSLPDWTAFVEWLVAAGGGVLIIRVGEGSLHGLATYLPEEALRGGRRLRVENIVTFELSHDAPARRTLLAALERVARALGCVTLAVTLDNRGFVERNGYKADPWRMLGLQLAEVAFTKRVDVDDALLPLEAAASQPDQAAIASSSR